MNIIDLKGEMGEYLLDADRKIPKAHLNTVCKIYNKCDTCRYIFLSVNGFVCVKKTPLKKTIDAMAVNKKIQSFGDNCEGLGTYSPAK